MAWSGRAFLSLLFFFVILSSKTAASESGKGGGGGGRLESLCLRFVKTLSRHITRDTPKGVGSGDNGWHDATMRRCECEGEGGFSRPPLNFFLNFTQSIHEPICPTSLHKSLPSCTVYESLSNDAFPRRTHRKLPDATKQHTQPLPSGRHARKHS